MGKILVLVDNSNVFISGKESFGGNTRFSYGKFESICSGKDTIIEKHLAGSTPPSSDAFWDTMRRNGYIVHTYERVQAGYGHAKEKAVDMVLGVHGGRAIEKIKPDRVVLLTGDRDFIPIAELRDIMKKEQGKSFVLDVWAFSKALSQGLERACDNVYRIEDYKEDLIYFQYEDGVTETFIQREERLALEKKQRDEERVARKEKKDEEDRLAQEESEKFWGSLIKGALGVLGLAGLLILGKKRWGK